MTRHPETPHGDNDGAFEMELFISTLASAQLNESQPSVPDGLSNCSNAITPLRLITRNGRPFHSDVPGDRGRWLADVLREYFRDGITIKNLIRAVIGLSALIILILDSAHEIHPDMVPEEILMDAANNDSLRILEREFEAIEYSLDDNGTLRTNFGSGSVFSRSTPITDLAKGGFIRRRITPYLHDMYMSAEHDSPETASTSMQPGNEIVSLDDFAAEDLVADPLEGFDEMQEFFDRTDNQRFMNGETLDEILRNDPSEPDHQIGDS